MTLMQSRELLNENNIHFDEIEYETETEFLQHIALFPCTKNAKPCKVAAFVIRSNNGKKNIELQFNSVDGDFLFYELYFGEYSYEMSEHQEETLKDDLLDYILSAIHGMTAVIVANDMKNKRWLYDAGYSRNNNGDEFDESEGFQKAVKRIQKRKSAFNKIFNTKTQYEIYDWNSYQCIVK